MWQEKFCIGGQLYSYSELMELFLRPKVKGGVDIDDRTYHLKKYPRCFVGEDFTTYLMKNFNVPNRADAIQAAKQLQVCFPMTSLWDVGVEKGKRKITPLRSWEKGLGVYCAVA